MLLSLAEDLILEGSPVITSLMSGKQTPIRLPNVSFNCTSCHLSALRLFSLHMFYIEILKVLDAQHLHYAVFLKCIRVMFFHMCRYLTIFQIYYTL